MAVLGRESERVRVVWGRVWLEFRELLAGALGEAYCVGWRTGGQDWVR